MDRFDRWLFQTGESASALLNSAIRPNLRPPAQQRALRSFLQSKALRLESPPGPMAIRKVRARKMDFAASHPESPSNRRQRPRRWDTGLPASLPMRGRKPSQKSEGDSIDG